MNTLLDLINEAAHDDACISLRITLYRVARQSRLCESLISAAEHGKVTVLMELRARFDEENNIAWAERLEEAKRGHHLRRRGLQMSFKMRQLTITTRGASSASRSWARATSTKRRRTCTPTSCS